MPAATHFDLGRLLADPVAYAEVANESDTEDRHHESNQGESCATIVRMKCLDFRRGKDCLAASSRRNVRTRIILRHGLISSFSLPEHLGVGHPSDVIDIQEPKPGRQL